MFLKELLMISFVIMSSMAAMPNPQDCAALWNAVGGRGGKIVLNLI